MILDTEIIVMVYPAEAVRDQDSLEGPAKTILQLAYAHDASCVSILETFDTVREMLKVATGSRDANK